MKIRYLIGVVIITILVLAGVYFFILPPRVIGVSPPNQGLQVDPSSPLVIRFDKPVKRQILNHFIVSNVYGEWKFGDPLIRNHLFRSLIFEPAIGFQNNTSYRVELKNIVNPLGLGIPSDFSFTFSTIPMKKKASEKSVKNLARLKPSKPLIRPKVTLINVAPDWQDHRLSCEAASLKMALAAKGVFVSEGEIMQKIGFDRTPHRDGIWGDPYKAFVGNIDGKICSSGYGVYWPVVAKAASNWRPAEARSNWKLKDLTEEIVLGNPVVVWGSLPVRTLHDCSWHTPEGKYIKAIREDHVRVVIGFIGSPERPSKIILNDPLSGRVYWSTSYFLTNWKAFDYSGVVIR